MDFIALGGTDETGASCYYIELAGTRILLDCGKGFNKVNGFDYGVNFSKLLDYADMVSLSQIDAVFISHAHFDHIAYLSYIARECRNTPVYATHITKVLGRHLMWDRLQLGSRPGDGGMLPDDALNNIHTVSYGRPVRIGNVKADFYNAGHIPGAMMVYFESDEKNVLYTGDFMKKGSYLTTGYRNL